MNWTNFEVWRRRRRHLILKITFEQETDGISGDDERKHKESSKNAGRFHETDIFSFSMSINLMEKQ